MKAISLWQPWASLVAWGEKDTETRSWETSYRGPLAIHATKKVDHSLNDNPHFVRAMAVHGFPNFATANSEQRRAIVSDLLPTGAILGVCGLLNCVRFGQWQSGNIGFLWTSFQVPNEGRRTQLLRFSAQERAFGNYAAGRYGWILTNVRALPEPVSCRGNRRLWTPDATTLAAITAEGGMP